MKNQWLVYLIVAVISVGAGVAIAGTPSSDSAEVSIVAPPTTVAPPPTVVPTAPPTTVVEIAVSSGPLEETTTTIAIETTTTTTEPEIDRAVLAVVAVNGAGTGGVAGAARTELIGLGYEATRTDDGTTFVDDTVVYFFEGYELEAETVATDLGLDPTEIQPVEDAPDISFQDGDQVVVYLGRDRS